MKMVLFRLKTKFARRIFTMKNILQDVSFLKFVIFADFLQNGDWE